MARRALRLVQPLPRGDVDRFLRQLERSVATQSGGEPLAECLETGRWLLRGHGSDDRVEERARRRAITGQACARRPRVGQEARRFVVLVAGDQTAVLVDA